LKGVIAVNRLTRTARTLGRRCRHGKALPSLWLLTDPQRVPDPVSAAAKLPPGSGVIYRAFGAADALSTATALVKLARSRRLTVLIGADEALAAAAGAQGIHLPERMLGRAPRIRARHRRWLVTGAAHGGRALRLAQRAGLDAAFLSVVFPSRSPSAGAPMGPVRLALRARRARIRVIALGGITKETAPRLLATGACGLAAIEGLLA
jgi:thiamine-phosphate pyrophosphorylase